MDGISKLKFISIGLVAANKELNSRTIEVCPIEDNIFLDGEITDNASNYEAEGTDASGAKYKDSIINTVSIKAVWLPMGSSNRLTAPDVRRGESVAIYRFADTDEYMWVTLKDDSHLRRLETVIYAFSGTQVEGDALSAANSYFLEISTHNGMVHFHTSNANGEPYVYDIQINTKEGFIQIQDDTGNYIKFDSKEEQLSIANKSGSLMEVNKKIINFSSSDSINLKTTNYNLDCTNATLLSDVTNETATSSLTTKTGALSLTAETSTFKADTHDSTAIVTQSGNVDITGDTTITGTETINGPTMLMGPATLGAGMTMSPGGGKASIGGDVEITGSLMNNGVNIGSTHVHGGVMGGPGSTSTPS